MYHLDEIIRNLKAKDEVDTVFITGSHGLGEEKPYSDIDLVVVLKENSEKIRSVFTWIDGQFADVFFFDHSDLARMGAANILEADSMDGIFISWLKKASIFFDKSGKVTRLVSSTKDLRISVPESRQKEVWQKINYNYIANKRYYESNDPLYREALELRLLYSAIELITGYLALRGILWRGEKEAVKYLKEHDPKFYSLFLEYTAAENLEARFAAYSKIVKAVFPTGYKLWEESDVITMFNDQTLADEGTQAAEYWDHLVS